MANLDFGKFSICSMTKSMTPNSSDFFVDFPWVLLSIIGLYVMGSAMPGELSSLSELSFSSCIRLFWVVSFFRKKSINPYISLAIFRKIPKKVIDPGPILNLSKSSSKIQRQYSLTIIAITFNIYQLSPCITWLIFKLYFCHHLLA